MPSDVNEPALEELSAYLDHELDGDAQTRVAAHVAGCQDCQARLDGLRQTTYAVRALPMQTPPRTFTIPAQREGTSRRWAPAAWLGGVAAAMLVVVLGVTQLHFHPPAGTANTSTISGGLAQGAVPSREVPPTAETQALDKQAYALRAAANRVVIVDPTNPSRSLTVATYAQSYASTGILSFHVTSNGLSFSEASSVRLLLIRQSGQGGYSVRLGPPSKASTFPYDYDAAYSIPQMQLPQPVAGNYTLQVTIDRSGGSALVASVPLTIGP
jgi:hypothetical protein